MFVPTSLHRATAESRHLDRLARAGAALFEVGLTHRTASLDGPVVQAADLLDRLQPSATPYTATS